MTNTLPSAPGEFLLYETEDGRTRVECRFVDDALWRSLEPGLQPSAAQGQSVLRAERAEHDAVKKPRGREPKEAT